MTTRPVANSPEDSDLTCSIRELLSEVREQRQEINSLKEEVRGNTVSVRSEVKKVKSEQDLKWRRYGNRIQYEFNAELQENIKQVNWALDNNKLDYARDIVNECCESLKKRNKHIRIADTTEGGWETVRQYEVNPVASDSDDESRINRAESRAVRRKKALQKTNKRFKSSTSTVSASQPSFSDNMFQYSVQQPRQFLQQQQQQQLFRPSQYNGSFRGSNLGPCFACGESTHFRRNCPYTRSAPQPDTPVKK